MKTDGRTDGDEMMDLVGLIYEAALDGGRWPDVLEGIARVTQSTSLFLHAAVAREGSSGGGVAYDFDPEFLQSHRDHYWKISPIDPSHRPDIDLDRVPRIALPERKVKDFWDSAYNHEWMVPQGLQESFTVLLPAGGRPAGLSGMRAIGQEWYAPETLDVLEVLQPHLTRALAIQKQTSALAADRLALAHLLDRFTTAVFMLDERGSLRFANSPADALLNRRDGLSDHRGSLRALDDRVDRDLQRAIGRALGGDGDAPPSGGALRLPRVGGGTLEVLVAPLGRLDAMTAFGVRAALFVSEPDQAHDPMPAILQSLYQLTAAEAAMAIHLMNGLSVEEAADRGRVTLGTARNRLKRIFSKTGTRRQGELVRVLLRGVGGLRRPVPGENGG